MRLLAVDPSLTCSGWALFSIIDKQLIAVGKIRSLSSSVPLAERLVDLQHRIEKLLKKMDLGGDDYLVCEAPTTVIDPRAAFIVEQVRSIFEVTARGRGVAVPGRINPRSVQKEILGLKGAQQKRKKVKEAAVLTVHRLYKQELTNMGFNTEVKNLQRHQDIVDAILIGALASSKIKTVKAGREDLSVVFSLAYDRYKKKH